MKTRYWIIVASKDHVQNGIEEGITQTCHGKASPLKRMQKNDLVVFYSGKKTLGGPDKCQEFTAIGKLKDDEIFQVQISPEFCPFRRRIDFLPSSEVSILPLINDLDFIENKKYWGYPFRFGFFEIKQHDFDLISTKMLQQTYD